MKFSTEVHWTNIIDLSRGPNKKGHFPPVMTSFSWKSWKFLKYAHMGFNRPEIILVNIIDGFCGEDCGADRKYKIVK